MSRIFSLILLPCLLLVSHASALNLKAAASKVADELPKPTISLKNVDVTSITFDDIHFLFTISIKNPYPISLHLDKVKCDFNLDKIKVLSTETVGGLKVAANASSDSKLDVVLTYKSIMEAAKAYSDSDRVTLQLAGSIEVIIPDHNKVKGAPASISIPFTITKSIPTVKPVVTIKNFKVEVPDEKAIADAIAKSATKNLNPTSVKKAYRSLFSGKKEAGAPAVFDPKDLDLVFKTSFDIELKNETKAKLAFKSLNYIFSVNGQKVLNGETSEISGQDTANTTIIRVNSDLSSKNLGEAVVKAFRSRKADYTLDGATYIALPPDIKPEPLKLNFSVSGSTNF